MSRTQPTRRLIALAVLAGCACAPQAVALPAGATAACTISWDGGAGTASWFDRDNWSTDKLPAPSDSACIASGEPAVEFDEVASVQVAGLQTSRPLAVSAGVLTVAGPAALATLGLSGGTVLLNGDTALTELDQSGGTLDGSGTVSITGSAAWSGGTEAGTGHTIVSSGSLGIAIGGGQRKTLARRTFTNFASSAWSGAGDIALEDGATLVNRGELAADTTGGGFVAGAGGGAVVNAGAITVQSALGVAVALGSEPGSTLGGAGPLTVETGATVKIEGGYAVDATTVRGGELAFEGTGEGAPAELELEGGEARFDRDATVQWVRQRGGTLSGSATVLVTRGYDWSGGKQAGSGMTRISAAAPAGIQITGDADKALSARTLENNGPSRWEGGGSIELSEVATLHNRAELVVETAGAGEAITAGTDGGTVVNGGTLDVRRGTTLRVPIENSGDVRIAPGAGLDLAAGGRHVGARVTLGSGSALMLGAAGTSAFDDGSTIAGPGTVRVTGSANVAIAGGYDVATTTIGGAGRLALAPGDAATAIRSRRVELTGGELALDGGAFAGSVANDGGAVTLADGAALLAGAGLGPGTYTQTAGATVLGPRSRIEFTDRDTGRLDLRGGALSGSGSVVGDLLNGGELKPGGPLGALSVKGDYVQGPFGTLAVDVQTSVIGGDFDQLDVTGSASLAGALTVAAPADFAPPDAGLPVVRAAARHGSFSSFIPGPRFDAEYRPDGVALVPAAECRSPLALSALARTPVLGDVLNLSRRADRAIFPKVARVTGGTAVVWLQEGVAGGIRFRKVRDDGRPEQATIVSGGGGEFLRWDVSGSGDHVYVVWEQATRDPGIGYASTEVWLAASADGGATFGAPVRVSGSPGETSWFPRVAGSGSNVSVVWVDGSVLVHAVSTDGGATFTPGRRHPLTAHAIPGDYDVAQSGASAYVAFVKYEAEPGGGTRRVGPVMLARSLDGGVTHSTDAIPWSSEAAGAVRVAASGDHVHVGWVDPVGKAGELKIAGSADRGVDFTPTDLTEPGDRVQASGSPYAISADGNEVAVAWAGEARPGADDHVFVRHSADGGGSFDAAVDLGPGFGAAPPQVAESEGHVYVSWFLWAAAGWPPDVVLAASADGGRTYARTGGAEFRLPADRCGEVASVTPGIAALGDAFGVAWMSTDTVTGRTRLEVGYRGGRLGRRDLELAEVEAVQAPYGVKKLVADKPTVIRARVVSGIPAQLSVPIRVRYTDSAGTQTIEESVLVAPGDRELFLPLGDPIAPKAGPLDYTVTLDPRDEVPEEDETNNARSGSATVEDTRPLKVLVVPMRIAGEDEPSCADVHDVARGTGRYVGAAWPLSPLEVRFDPLCVPIELDSEVRDPTALASVFFRLERATWGTDYDKAIGVVRRGWFKDQTSSNKKAVALAPTDSLFDAALVEEESTGGWVTAHEIAHQMGWVAVGEPDEVDRHQDDVPAPGYWVAGRMALSRIDLMHHATEGADLGSPTARWTAPNTWAFLLSKFAADAADPPVIAISGTVASDGHVQADPFYALDGVVDAPLGSSGEVGVRFLDAGGHLLGTAGFDATHRLEGTALDPAPFTARLPDVPGTAKIEITVDGGVAAVRARSAAAPSVEVDGPSPGAAFAPGDEIAAAWASSDADGDALTHLVQLSTDGGAHWMQLADSLTGSSFAFRAPSLSTDDARIRVIATDGLNTTTAVSGRFSIRGVRNGRIAFSRGWRPKQIVTIDPGGTGERALPQQPDTCTVRSSPDWSPDGTKLAFYGSGASCESGLWTMNADGSDPHVIVRGDGIPSADETTGSPDWSPDGLRIAYHVVEAGVDLIGVVGADGADPTTLAASGRPDNCPDLNPSWSPDGRTIAFDRGACDAMGIWVMDADGTHRRALFAEPGYQREPAFSPDGTRIAFTRGGGLAVMDADGSDVEDLLVACCWADDDDTAPTPGDGHGLDVHEPAWAPDGTTIAFARRTLTGGPFSVFSIHPDGSARTRLTSAGDPIGEPNGGDLSPSWQGVAGSGAAPSPLVARAGGPYHGVEGEPIELDASASSPSDAIVAYDWDLDGDGRYDDAAGPTAERAWGDDGAGVVAVRVTDGSGDVATATAAVTVGNVSPHLTGVTAVPDARGNGRITATVVDHGAADTPAAEVDWGDGAPPRPATVVRDAHDAWQVLATHDYGSTNSHVVVIRVEDGDGGADSRTVTLASPPPNRAPVADAQHATTIEGAPVALELSAADPDGDPVTLEVAKRPEHGIVSLLPRGAATPMGVPIAIYTPAAGFAGEDRFTIAASDGLARSAEAAAAITVERRSPATPPEPPRPLDPIPSPRPGPGAPGPPASTAVPVAQLAELPSARRCVSRRHFRIRLRHRVRGETVISARVSVNGHLVRVTRGRRLTAPVDLRGLPRGRFRVTIEVVTQSGRRYRGTRRYRTCRRARLPRPRHGVAGHGADVAAP